MLTLPLRRQVWGILWIIMILFALNTLALAQEATEEPAPTATSEPTAMPTLTPVPPTETPLPTATETVEVTEEPTVEPTVVVTEEPTSEIPPEVTEEPTAEATVVVTDEPTVEPTVETPGPQIVSELPAPLLKAPANGAIVNSVRPKLTWFKSNGSKGYRIDLADNMSFTDPLLEDYPTSSTTLALNNKVLANELRPGVYYWRVQVVDSLNEWSLESIIFQFTVSLEKSPSDNTFTTNNRTALSWIRAQDALRYRLQVSEAPDFGTTIVDWTTPDNRATRYSPTSSEPLPTNNLWWRVDVEYADGWVTSLTPFALTVTPKPLAAPTLLTPANRGFTNDNQPEFTWTEVLDPGQSVSYWLQVSTTSNFREIVFEALEPTTSYLGEVLPEDGRYYARVATLNYLNAPSKWSRSISFTLDTIDPEPPVLNSPKDGSSTNKSSYAFKWKGDKGSATYELRLGTDNPPVGGVVYDTGKKTSFKLTANLLTTTYYWQVRAFDAAGNDSAWSAPFSFNVESPSNAVPLLNRFSTATPNLSWTPISWSQGYEVEVATNNNFSNVVYSIDTLPNSSLNHTLATPLADGVYYWRVRARSGAETWGTWSTTGTFLIQTS